VQCDLSAPSRRPEHVTADVMGQVVRFPQRDRDGRSWEAWVPEGAVAHHFAVSARTVRRWRNAGMPSERFQGSRRYRLSECERWHVDRSPENEEA
jgi:hypothetical protein